MIKFFLKIQARWPHMASFECEINDLAFPIAINYETKRIQHENVEDHHDTKTPYILHDQKPSEPSKTTSWLFKKTKSKFG